ncbi:hydrolase [Sutcliffiella sp. NC1]|uniref:hydrolase n=1 Tax=Sutcliffiella sp. NC1 TaxID=3004096 RepID=UPI0022DDD088|nr:hydrolase [Sutcliffiella sp. NC1]WBL14217.1 hydrolase [Sutcliffiella sp. NC1]
MVKMEKKTYYVSLAEGVITQVKTATSWDYEIQANDEEITKLRELFDQNYSSDWQSFWRAHVPYIQYHNDKQNDGYDNGLQLVFKMLYELGDDETKAHIKNEGLLDGPLS